MPFRIQRALIDNIYNLLVSDKGAFYVKRRLERGWVTWWQEAWDSQGRRERLAAVAAALGRGDPQVWTWRRPLSAAATWDHFTSPATGLASSLEVEKRDVSLQEWAG